MKRGKLQYFGHVIRAQNLDTGIQYGFVEGKRSRGRQRKRWMDLTLGCAMYGTDQRLRGLKETGASTFHGPRSSDMRKRTDKTRQFGMNEIKAFVLSSLNFSCFQLMFIVDLISCFQSDVSTFDIIEVNLSLIFKFYSFTRRNTVQIQKKTTTYFQVQM